MAYIERNDQARANRDPMVRYLHLIGRGIGNSLTKKPFCISLEVTFHCNARCKHCNRGGPVVERRASPRRFGEICRTIKPLVAQLSGGEPLLRNDLEEIIKEIRVPNRPPVIVVITNGALLDERRYLRLREAGANAFSISLDYPDERHDEFRGLPGLFSHIESLVRGLPHEDRRLISLCCVIQRRNFRELVRVAELAKSWDVNVNFSVYTTLRTHDQSFMIPLQELKELRECLAELAAFSRKSHNVLTSDYLFERIPLFFERGFMPDCRTGTRFLNVNPDGTLSPCGLITKNYGSQRELREMFSRNNTCMHCYTSIRGNSEKPIWCLVRDHAKLIWH